MKNLRPENAVIMKEVIRKFSNNSLKTSFLAAWG